MCETRPVADENHDSDEQSGRVTRRRVLDRLRHDHQPDEDERHTHAHLLGPNWDKKASGGCMGEMAV